MLPQALRNALDAVMAGVPVPILLLSVDTKAKESDKKVIICAGVPQALTKQLHAGQWAGAVAAVLGGNGGKAGDKASFLPLLLDVFNWHLIERSHFHAVSHFDVARRCKQLRRRPEQGRAGPRGGCQLRRV
jgi:hypothetical protein